MNVIRVLLAAAALLGSFAVCAAGARHVVQTEPPPDPRAGTVSAQDFFRYACMSAYMKAHAIRNFDGSLAYAVEYSDVSGEVLSALHDAASKYARSLPAPNFRDTEHGLYPVQHACEREAASNKVRVIVRKASTPVELKAEPKSVERPVRRP